MEEIIDRVPREAILAELTPEKKLRRTNKSGNDIYIVTAHDSPNVMREIGRLREIAFRAAGGGTGKSMDIDEYDTMEKPYSQLLVWDPEAQEILGGYRYLLGKDWQIGEDGQPILATSHMFRFSDRFMSEYAPWTIELGRSFVTLEYQSTLKGRKGIFALDNLWDGTIDFYGRYNTIHPVPMTSGTDDKGNKAQAEHLTGKEAIELVKMKKVDKDKTVFKEIICNILTIVEGVIYSENDINVINQNGELKNICCKLYPFKL